MEIQVSIEREKDGDMKGKLFVYMGDVYSSGYKVYVSSIEDAAEEVKEFILDNYDNYVANYGDDDDEEE